MLSGALSSCGGSKKADDPYKLTPETTSIKGGLSDYYEVVDKEYSTTENYLTMMDNIHTIVSVEIRRNDKPFDFDSETTKPMGTLSAGMTGNAGFGIEILDESGNVINKSAATNGGLGGMYSDADMKEALNLKPGETSTVRWQINFAKDDKPAKFRLTSAYEKSGYEGDATGATQTGSSANNWDAILDSYEQYVNQYIKVSKKAMNGDMSATAEMAGIIDKAEKLEKKLKGAEADMTPSQISRLAKINSKLIEAM